MYNRFWFWEPNTGPLQEQCVPFAVLKLPLETSLASNSDSTVCASQVLEFKVYASIPGEH